MNKLPFDMIYKQSSSSSGKHVWVFDFVHDNIGSFESFALCWDPHSNSWFTTPVAFLEPVITAKKVLSEELSK